ncbi:MAG: hypothetical protein MJ101_05580 [Clostridia bacterium]|nr:hypothetical protein [Clostridia bacterium]
MTRTQNSIRNAAFAFGGQIAVLLTQLLIRWSFVAYLTDDYLSLNGLFSNILTVLSLAELGVGTSIVFSLYRPIADNDTEKIKSLMRVYRLTYTAVGTAVLIVGLAITPFLPYLVDQMPDIPEIYVIFVMYVFNSAMTYFFSYKRSFLIANQQKYLTTAVSAAAQIVACAAEYCILRFTHDYIIYMICVISVTIIDNVIVTAIADAKYPFLRNKHVAKLDDGTSSEIKTNIRASLLHNIGGVVVNGTDNIIISRFVGFVYVGLYSNYHLIRAAVDSLLRPLFEAVTASFGNLSVEVADERRGEVFNRMFFAAAWLFGFSSIALAILSGPFVSLWLGDEYLVSVPVVLIIAVNFYFKGMRYPGIAAREAMGLFRYDKWKSIAEAATNIVVSILLARCYGVFGVLLGTLISSLATCFWIEPLVLYRHGFGRGLGKYFIRYGLYTAVTVAAGIITRLVCGAVELSPITSFVVKALICLTIPNVIFAAAYFRTSEFRYYVGLISSRFKNKSIGGK